MLLSRVTFFAQNNIRATGARSADLIKVILAACSSYEAASGMSGALAFNDRFFVQVMEGDREIVTRQFLKTASDPRLGGVTLVGFCDIAERAFGGWTVAYAGANAEEFARVVLRHSVASHLDPTRMSEQAIVGLLADMSKMESPYVQRSSIGRMAPAGEARAPAAQAPAPSSVPAPAASAPAAGKSPVIERIPVTRVVA